MKTILVTGGAGFIGSEMATKLASNPEFKIVIADNLLTGELAKLPDPGKFPNVEFANCDVNNYQDIARLFYTHQFDYVFHYAALVGVQRTLSNPVKVLQDIRGIEYILNLSKIQRVKRVFFSSSSEVYGEPVEFPQNEKTTPLNSRLPYAVVKNVGEAFLRSYQQEFGLDYTIFRFFNTYGPKQSKDFVVSRFIRLALKDQPITVYGDGMQTRTFCFVQDNIDACYNAFTEDKFINDVVNIGGENEIPVIELARKIIEITGSKSTIEHLPALAEGDMTRRLPDTSKMKELLRREPLNLEQGIRKILENTSYIL